MSNLVELFWRYAKKQSKVKCWIWTGSTNGRYGIVQYPKPRKNFGAHRVSYEIHKGKIPSNMSVLHTCDNPLCVNPHHLFLGSQLTNIRDMISKGRRVQPNVIGELNGRAKLTATEAAAIRTSTSSTKELSTKYKVCKGTIYAIKKHRLWSHI